MAVLCVLYLGAVFAGFIAPYSYDHQHRDATFHPPMLGRVYFVSPEGGLTRPYVFLGEAVYVSHEGERPMSILWRLKVPMPAALLREAQVAAG